MRKKVIASPGGKLSSFCETDEECGRLSKPLLTASGFFRKLRLCCSSSVTPNGVPPSPKGKA